MAISEDLVRHTAYLARIILNQEELKLYAQQLARILDYIKQLAEVETRDIEPTSHILNIKNVFREDKVSQSILGEEIFKSAPKRKGNFFSVPKVF